MTQHPVQGNSYLRLTCDRSKEGGVVEERNAVARDHLVWGVTQDQSSGEETLKMWELLDEEKSRDSIRNGGKAVGYGPRIQMSITEFNENQRSHSKDTGVQLSQADGSSALTLAPNPKQRQSRYEKAASKQAKQEAQNRKKQKRERRDEAAASVARSQYRGDIQRCCGRCQLQFMTKGGLLNHARHWCKSRKEDIRSKQRIRQVPQILADMDQLCINVHTQRASSSLLCAHRRTWGSSQSALSSKSKAATSL